MLLKDIHLAKFFNGFWYMNAVQYCIILMIANSCNWLKL